MQIPDFIGKILYPRQQTWERNRNVKILFVVISITLIFIALFGLAAILKGSIQIDPDSLLGR